MVFFLLLLGNVHNFAQQGYKDTLGGYVRQQQILNFEMSPAN